LPTLINDILYLGTKENGYSTTATVFNNLTPAGPLRNADPAKQQLLLWTVFGDYDVRYNLDLEIITALVNTMRFGHSV
jgi:hypothetical protein